MSDSKGTITREIVVFKMRDALSDLSSLIGKAYPEYKECYIRAEDLLSNALAEVDNAKLIAIGNGMAEADNLDEARKAIKFLHAKLSDTEEHRDCLLYTSDAADICSV